MKIIHFSILIMILLQASAQRPYYRPNVHEISLQPLGFNYANSQDFISPSVYIFPVGVRYKYHFNQTASARGGIFYRHYNSSDPQFPATTRNMNYIEAKGGYEKAFNMRKYQIFGGADAIGGLRSVKGIGATEGTNAYYGGGAFFGVKRYFKENISLTIENDFYYIFHPKFGKEGEKEGVYGEVGTNFLQVYLSIHFKRQFKTCACGKPGS